MKSFLPCLALASVVLLARAAGAEEALAPVAPLPPAPPASEYQPLPPPPDGAVMRVKSKPLIIGGSILAGLGVGAAIAGGVTLALANRDTCPKPVSYGTAICEVGRSISTAGGDVLGIGLLVGGAAFTIAGVPMIVSGAQKVPASVAWSRPDVLVGPASGALRWSF